MMTILITIVGTYLFIGLAVGTLIIFKELKDTLEYETDYLRIAINVIGIIIFWLPLIIKEMFTD